MRHISLFLAIPLAVHGFDLSWYLGSNCTGEELYNKQYSADGNCHGIPSAAANAQSVVAYANHAVNHVIFYGTGDCTGEPIASVANTTCVPNQNASIKSFKFEPNKKKRSVSGAVGKRAPEQLDAEIEGLFAERGLDLHARDGSLNRTELGPPKSYDVMVPDILRAGRRHGPGRRHGADGRHVQVHERLGECRAAPKHLQRRKVFLQSALRLLSHARALRACGGRMGICHD
ncbi:hypothetical protein NLG97_g1061 [Lecanicillium saksenae]|uniref:Uncharacterized protein n=1 Tax=Lecanicillium saksenae TaxID=468837 RepID=A0ACC1R8X5_9HYPO|nr:hypothetical protein NLG97_g1061 [Lecanicillium saksenae]